MWFSCRVSLTVVMKGIQVLELLALETILAALERTTARGSVGVGGRGCW
jgi:hypothetical protein